MAVSSTWIMSLKVLLISTGAASLAMAMKFSVPLILDFVAYQLPVLWSALLTWSRPPYLYFVINVIIITIAASSRFHRKTEDKDESEPILPSKPPLPDQRPEYAVPSQLEFGAVELPAVYESKPGLFVISRSTWTPPQRMSASEVQSENLFPMTEKPLVSSRFGHRKPVKASPEGGRLRVAKPKRQETLENTWKTITDGRHVPLTRHLRKLETLENHGRQTQDGPPDPSSPVVKKAQTFRDRTNYEPPSPATSSPGSWKLRKEPSLSHDELNRRVEAFIRKFNEEMRLQRQESLRRYSEMINH
ncbi:hypothetical protein NMG60_11012622 [Bertholletia excelsa]